MGPWEEGRAVLSRGRGPMRKKTPSVHTLAAPHLTHLTAVWLHCVPGQSCFCCTTTHLGSDRMALWRCGDHRVGSLSLNLNPAKSYVQDEQIA